MSDSPAVDIEAHRLVRAGRFREALPLAERAVLGATVCLPGHALLASILLHLGRASEAEVLVARAAELGPGVAEAYDGLAYVSLALDRHETANLLYRRATELAPRVPRYWYNLACSERSFGRLAAAEEACDRSIALDPAQYQTYLLRSELRVQAPDANHIEPLQKRLSQPGIGSTGRIFLGYALAKELDDVQRFDDAFECFAAAARTRRSQIAYDIAKDEKKLRRIAAVFASGSEPRVLPESADSRCIFVMGLPRSGTTLVERILGGLTGVRSNGETDHFSRALAAASGAGGDMFERAGAADPRAVAAHYVRLAGLDRSGDRVIEKLPTNYLYAGAIQRALPRAKLLLVRRTPLDSCFAMFRTLFGDAYPFTYDFDELARYYAAYDALMVHWRAVLGAALFEIRYEDLVREPERVGAGIAHHCELAWSPDAVHIQSNRSVSLTASASQVRQPVYGTSSGRWRHYAAHLAPLMAALDRLGVSSTGA